MTDSSHAYAALRARYVQSFADKHAALAEAWRAFSARADDASARPLQVLVHRLAGSAPTYGFAAVGALASAVDAELLHQVERPDADGDGFDALARRLAAPMHHLLELLAAGEATAGSSA